MGTNYNITQKQYNGNDYDTLYPKNTSQQVLLNDSALATALGLSGTPNVNDVLGVLTNQGVRCEIKTYTGDNTESKSITFDTMPDLVYIYRTTPVGTGEVVWLLSPIVPTYSSNVSWSLTLGGVYTLGSSWSGTTLTIFVTTGTGSARAFNYPTIDYCAVGITLGA